MLKITDEGKLMKFLVKKIDVTELAHKCFYLNSPIDFTNLKLIGVLNLIKNNKFLQEIYLNIKYEDTNIRKLENIDLKQLIKYHCEKNTVGLTHILITGQTSNKKKMSSKLFFCVEGVGDEYQINGRKDNKYGIEQSDLKEIALCPIKYIEIDENSNLKDGEEKTISLHELISSLVSVIDL